MLIRCETENEAEPILLATRTRLFFTEEDEAAIKMELLASYGDDGDKSDSPDHSSDVGEKDAGPSSVRAPSFTPYLQAEWESFEKMIGGGGEGESQSGTTSNAQTFTPIPPPVADVSNGASQEIHRRTSNDNTQLTTETYPHSQSSSSSSPRQRSLSPSTSSSSSSSRSSSLDREKDSKRSNPEVINVASRSPSESIEPRSSSTSPVRVIHESLNRHSDSDSARHSSASRSRSNSSDRESPDQSPEHKQQRRTIKQRSRSRSRSRSHRRSRSRSSRHRKRKHSRKSRSRSWSRNRNRKHRGSKSSRKKNKHRRRSRSSRERQRSHEHRRSRSRDCFGRTMRGGRDTYRDRSPASTRRRSRSRERSRERESHRPAQRDYGRRDSRDAGSSRNKEKPLNFKEQMRQELIKASKMLNESNASNLTELMEDKKILEPSADQPNNMAINNAVLTNLAAATQNSTVTPQVALLQTMAAMHKKAQEITGIAVPKYYNPAAVNPLKYAEQVQKRKLLWSRPPKEKKEGGPENQWQGTHFSTDQDGKMAAKFRKLMGMKTGEAAQGTEKVGEERKKQQEELFSRLDKEYEFARMATHTHRGVGLGFQSQSFYPH